MKIKRKSVFLRKNDTENRHVSKSQELLDSKSRNGKDSFVYPILLKKWKHSGIGFCRIRWASSSVELSLNAEIFQNWEHCSILGLPRLGQNGENKKGSIERSTRKIQFYIDFLNQEVKWVVLANFELGNRKNFEINGISLNFLNHQKSTKVTKSIFWNSNTFTFNGLFLETLIKRNYAGQYRGKKNFFSQLTKQKVWFKNTGKIRELIQRFQWMTSQLSFFTQKNMFDSIVAGRNKACTYARVWFSNSR